MTIKWNEKRIALLLKEGRGEGVGAGYLPWIRAREARSHGHSYRVLSKKTGRVHQLLSAQEYAFFLRAEWSKNVLDIREQYPLNRALTQTLAWKMKVAHPRYPDTRTPAVMSADFLLTLANGPQQVDLAVDVKTVEDVNTLRTLEKLQIHRSYFNEIGIKHQLILSSRLARNVTANLNWLMMWRRRVGIEAKTNLASLKSEMLGWLDDLSPRQQDMQVRGLVTQFDASFELKRGTGAAVIRELMVERVLPVDLHCPDLTKARWRHLQSIEQQEVPLLLAA